MIYEKIKSRRTLRKYLQKEVPKEILYKCVDAARLSPSGANLQPLKYVIINSEPFLNLVFDTLKWAAYLRDYKPSKDEMPRAYIIILLDKSISKKPGHDVGIASMSISMVAFDEGLGSCILGAFNKEELKDVLNLSDGLDIVLVISLGYSSEKSVVEKVRDNDIKYWLDKNKVLHVPKRDFVDLVI
jgi:nitroreductase